MEIETFSIIAGSTACNARCPFCVSKMTAPMGVELKEPSVNWRNFHIACRLAKRCNVTTAMITSKGEATLFPGQVTKFLEELERYGFLVEMQTNGIMLAENDRYNKYLEDWFSRSLTTIAISIVHFEPERNKEIYLPYKDAYIDLPALIEKLHTIGFSVRLTCIAANGFIDSRVKLNHLIYFAKKNKVEQLTLTPVNKPQKTENVEVWNWTNEHHLLEAQLASIREYVEGVGKKLRTLSHGASVYDIEGQNFCLNHCLDFNADSKELRNLIFFPDGHTRSHWDYSGSIIF